MYSECSQCEQKASEIKLRETRCPPSFDKSQQVKDHISKPKSIKVFMSFVI